jgi:hypothetical protein
VKNNPMSKTDIFTACPSYIITPLSCCTNMTSAHHHINKTQYS